MQKTNPIPVIIHVKKFAFVCHPVADIAGAREFHEGRLALKLGTQIEFAPGRHPRNATA